jgi:hypothetical protein
MQYLLLNFEILLKRVNEDRITHLSPLFSGFTASW